MGVGKLSSVEIGPRFIDAGVDKKTLIVHDPLPNFSGNQYWTLKDDGTFNNKQGKAFWAVAESPIPESSTLLLFLFGICALAKIQRFRY
ncbi:MAG: PEP-CTERM sorting domain-containing protein [Bacteroidetes bacterium]|nr:PEP-CTERM sorting domain-containing protein [Bacteroidota bacterium]